MISLRKPIPIIACSIERESQYVNAVGRRSGDATRFGPVVRDAQSQLNCLPSVIKAELGI
jgi:hypothetical protein